MNKPQFHQAWLTIQTDRNVAVEAQHDTIKWSACLTKLYRGNAHLNCNHKKQGWLLVTMPRQCGKIWKNEEHLSNANALEAASLYSSHSKACFFFDLEMCETSRRRNVFENYEAWRSWRSSSPRPCPSLEAIAAQLVASRFCAGCLAQHSSTIIRTYSNPSVTGFAFTEW